MVTRKHFWRQIFRICEKYEVNYTTNWNQNNTKMAVFGHWEPTPEVVLSEYKAHNTTFGKFWPKISLKSTTQGHGVLFLVKIFQKLYYEL